MTLTEIFTPHNAGFGDRLATIQLLARLAAIRSTPVVLSDGGRGLLHHELVRALDLPIKIKLTAEPGNTPLSGYDIWATPFYKARETWDGIRSHSYVAYQFDGVSSPEKNPNPDDEKRILDHIENTYHMKTCRL